MTPREVTARDILRSRAAASRAVAASSGTAGGKSRPRTARTRPASASFSLAAALASPSEYASLKDRARAKGTPKARPASAAAKPSAAAPPSLRSAVASVQTVDRTDAIGQYPPKDTSMRAAAADLPRFSLADDVCGAVRLLSAAPWGSTVGDVVGPAMDWLDDHFYSAVQNARDASLPPLVRYGACCAGGGLFALSFALPCC